MRIALALPLLVLTFAAPVLAQAPAPDFIERPGVLEFSGQMIVRPLQSGALVERGASASESESIRERAARRLRPALVEYVPQTDEHIVYLPAGQGENDYARELMATGDYEYAEPNWICYPTQTIPNDQSYGQQWHHTKVRSPLAWDIHTGDSSMVVAIVDGGVMLDHTDLAAALVPGFNAEDRVPQSAGGDVSDVDGHGTFVAGLAGAIGNNGIYVAGMGWGFSIMPVRYYNTPGGGYLHNVLAGARWAAENGARCVNVSQTGVEYNSVQTTGAYVRSQGSLLIWAAGNDGRDLSWFDWEDVIIVGATNPSDGKASFSAYGQAVDVYAPGTDIISTGLPGGLAIGSGTSASSPIVAGICALLWSDRPYLTPAEVEEGLFATCVDLGAPGNDSYWGWGRVDSYAALRGPDPANYCGAMPNSAGSGAIIGSENEPSITANNFSLFASGGVPNKPGLYFYGPNQISIPFGEGLRCVGGSMFRLQPTVAFDLFGISSRALDFTTGTTGSGSGQILPGSTWNFQLWYRDPAGGPAGFNLSDALHVVFWP